VGEKSTQLALRGKHSSGSSTILEFKNSVDNGLRRLYKLLGASGNTSSGGNDEEVLTFKDLTGSGVYRDDITAMLAELENIMELSGDKINSSQLETILRGISDLVLSDGEIIVRSYSQYNTQDEVEVRGIFKTISNYPSWIKSGSHRGFKSSLINEIASPSYEFIELPSEKTLRSYNVY
jgi:hypothetical protein